MGATKRALEAHEENLALATAYLVSVGKLKCCEFHDEVYGGGWSEGELDSDFYRFAMAERNRGDNGRVPWASELEAREFTDALKDAYDEHCGAECGWCAKWRDE